MGEREHQRRGSRDRKGSGGRNRGSDRKRSGSGAPRFGASAEDESRQGVDPEDVNEVNHWSDDEDEFEEPYEVAAARQKGKQVTFSLEPQIYTHEVENIIVGRTKLLKKKSRARVGTQTPSKTDSRESVREARHRAKAMRAEVISEGEENDEYGAFSVQSRRWLMDTGTVWQCFRSSR
eukprot:5150045-Amphidinium_carterae.2